MHCLDFEISLLYQSSRQYRYWSRELFDHRRIKSMYLIKKKRWCLIGQWNETNHWISNWQLHHMECSRHYCHWMDFDKADNPVKLDQFCPVADHHHVIWHNDDDFGNNWLDHNRSRLDPERTTIRTKKILFLIDRFTVNGFVNVKFFRHKQVTPV